MPFKYIERKVVKVLEDLKGKTGIDSLIYNQSVIAILTLQRA